MAENPNGIGGSAGYPGAPDGFYRTRDDLVGGSDTAWTDAATFDPADVPTVDMRGDDDTRAGGVLSQADLAGGSDYNQADTQIYGR